MSFKGRLRGLEIGFKGALRWTSRSESRTLTCAAIMTILSSDCDRILTKQNKVRKIESRQNTVSFYEVQLPKLTSPPRVIQPVGFKLTFINHSLRDLEYSLQEDSTLASR